MVTCVFNFKAMPFNNYQKSAINGRRYTTEKGKKYTHQIDRVLKNYSPEISSMMAGYNDQTRMFRASLFIFQSNFYKKDKTFHKRAGDCDGYQKIIFDRFFNFIGYDDYLLNKFTVVKSHSAQDFFVLKVDHFESISSRPIAL